MNREILFKAKRIDWEELPKDQRRSVEGLWMMIRSGTLML